jgi:hypothetical protein
MQLKKWLFTSFGIFILYLTFWSLVKFSGILKNHPDDDLSIFLPASTKYAVRIYTDNVVKKCFQELLFYKKDDTTQEKFAEFAQTIVTKSDSTLTQTSNVKDKFQGIDLYNDMIFFEFVENQITYSGILCHVSDSMKFNNYNNDKNFIKLSKASIGIVLQQESGQKKSLLQIASKVLLSDGSQKLNKKRNSTNALADIYLSVKNESEELSEINLELNAEPRKINILGKVRPPILKSNNTSSYLLQAKNLNFCLKDIPEKMNLEIQKWFNQNKLPELEFEEIQINYEGLDIGFTASNLAINPKFEAIFKTKNETKINEYLSNIAVLNSIGGKIDSGFVLINKTQYFFEQLDSCSFYIGNNHKPIYEKRLILNPLSIRGKLSHLTNVQTGGMDFLLNIVPLYTSMSNYFLNIEKFNFQITQDTKQNNFSGNMEFKAGRNAFFESLLLFTELQELKTLLK